MKYCAVCLIAKDEEYYLKEWCEYHLRIGFDALIIYDNGSKMAIKEVLKYLIDIDRVIVHEVPGEFKQTESYNSCIEQYRDDFKWIAFIDSDEFIFLKKTANIKIFLAEYENYGGVVANWVNFGTGGLLKRKDNSQIFNFVLTDNSESSTIKSIIQPAKAKTQGIHGAVFSDNYYAVSSDHVPLHENCYSSPFVNDKIQINHYLYRTWEDYERKLKKKRSNGEYRKAVRFEDEQEQYTKPALELMKFYASIKNYEIKYDSGNGLALSSVNNFTKIILSMIQLHKFIDVELLCCDAVLTFDDNSMIYYFRAVISRITNNLQRALHFIYEALKLSGSSTIYYEYARILDALNEHEKSRLAKKHADYKKYVEDTTCESVT
ncbi:MAG: glycosyltransferase family 2 protein [Deltaproteobacteria bacterium]|nr:glycosyltransferase family 2 protein [Deltaproteobacteria bacterium]